MGSVLVASGGQRVDEGGPDSWLALGRGGEECPVRGSNLAVKWKHDDAPSSTPKSSQNGY